ncbi:MAG: hypothetical protein J0L73_14415 [Verrucomicrobia bacterium]|nr:hypothetical protein [Verrucomicrobiota bacterium]
MNFPALPRDSKTWKVAAVVAMGLFVVVSVVALAERWLHPERAQHERRSGHPERLHRGAKPSEVERQFEEFRQKH